MLFDRILVPLDGSGLAAAVLPQVRRILVHKQAEVVLVQAAALPPGVEGDAVELPELCCAKSLKYLEEVAETLRAEGARVRTTARLGDPAEVILNAASEEKASLIAMSTHGRTGLSRLIRGSVAEKVLRDAGRPLLSVRSFPPLSTPELRLERILVPLAATEASARAVDPVLEVATLFGSRVTFLHVCEGPACSDRIPQLISAVERLQSAGVEVDSLTRKGDPALQILETARERRADLIAMTSHARSGVTRWMLGSVAENVMRAAETPLLVLNPK